MPRIAPLLALFLTIAVAPQAQGQLTVRPLRNLGFGPVIQGIPKHILPSDAINSGEFDFTATLGNRVMIAFTLPTRLNGPAAATMPISFNTTDAIALGTGPTSVPVTFNPNVTPSFTLVSSNHILVFIGGTVSPTAGQRTGAYTGTITLTITIF